jgi:ubiquinone/menaquinone biosynthesis C-methylase UbiE
MLNPSAEMRSYYAARAAEYDQVYLKPERQRDIAWLRSWLPTQFIGSRMLDVAAGTGFWSQDIVRAANLLVAIDASTETLAVARGRLTTGNVRFVVGDAYQLPVRRSIFNAAFVGFWFSHIPRARRGAFLSGLDQVLDPGSTVVLLDNMYVEGSNHPVSTRDAEGNTYQSRRLQDGSWHRVLKNFPTRGEVEDAVREVGEELDFTAMTYYWAFRYKTVGAGRV